MKDCVGNADAAHGVEDALKVAANRLDHRRNLINRVQLQTQKFNEVIREAANFGIIVEIEETTASTYNNMAFPELTVQMFSQLTGD